MVRVILQLGLSVLVYRPALVCILMFLLTCRKVGIAFCFRRRMLTQCRVRNRSIVHTCIRGAWLSLVIEKIRINMLGIWKACWLVLNAGALER